MKNLEKLLHQGAARHNHLCPRQVLGVRMGLYAGNILGLDLPQRDKRLFTFIETDGCTADGLSVSTGCWVGRRTMRILDFGKIAATFVDTLSGDSIRIHPRPEARQLCQKYAPGAPDRWHAYLFAYQVMPDDELFIVQQVHLAVSMAAFLSREDARAHCAQCGEEIINEREVMVNGVPLCRYCAGENYYIVESELKLFPQPTKLAAPS